MSASKLLLLSILLAFSSLAGAASISLSASTPDTISQGESTTVTVTATAQGGDLSNVDITISLPSGLSTPDAAKQTITTISSGQSQSVSWTVQGDSGGTYTITFNASGGATGTANTTLSVTTPAVIEIANKVCSASSASVGGTFTMSFQVQNTGGSATNAQVDMSYASSLVSLSSGQDPWSSDINAGGTSSLSYTFTASNTGSPTITAAVTSNQNNPTDPTCTVTISAVCGDNSCSTGESCSADNAACPSGYSCTNGCRSTTGPSGTTTADTTAGTTGGGAAAVAPGQVKVFEKGVSHKPTPEIIRALLTTVGASETAIEKASAAVGKTSISSKIVVDKNTDSKGKSTYTSTITIKVVNLAGKKLQGVKIIVEVPKEIAQNASEITSPHRFTVLIADPILQFTVEEIGAEDYAEFSYSIAKNVSEAQFDAMSSPIVWDFQEIEPKEAAPSCEGVNIADDNPCTTDYCTGGTVYHDAIPGCPKKPYMPSVTREEFGWLPWAVGIIVVIIVIGAAYYFYGSKSKSWGFRGGRK